MNRFRHLPTVSRVVRSCAGTAMLVSPDALAITVFARWLSAAGTGRDSAIDSSWAFSSAVSSSVSLHLPDRIRTSDARMNRKLQFEKLIKGPDTGAGFLMPTSIQGFLALPWQQPLPGRVPEDERPDGVGVWQGKRTSSTSGFGIYLDPWAWPGRRGIAGEQRGLSWDGGRQLSANAETALRQSSQKGKDRGRRTRRRRAETTTDAATFRTCSLIVEHWARSWSVPARLTRLSSQRKS